MQDSLRMPEPEVVRRHAFGICPSRRGRELLERDGRFFAGVSFGQANISVEFDSIYIAGAATAPDFCSKNILSTPP